jgi:hypothetical protein
MVEAMEMMAAMEAVTEGALKMADTEVAETMVVETMAVVVVVVVMEAMNIASNFCSKISRFVFR